MRGRCEHDPTAPRLALVVAAIPSLPKFIRDTIARAPRMFDHPRMFPELTGHSVVGRGMRLRARRSSRREAHALMAASIARHTDRRTFRIGDQRDDGLCNGVTVARHMAETGLSRYRVNETLREFEAAAYIITSDQPVEAMTDPKTGAPIIDPKTGKQRHRAFAAQRRVTPLFFQRFAFTADRIERTRARAYQEWRRRRAPAYSAVAILEGRRDLRRLNRTNARRNRRLERGSAYAPPPPPPPAARPDQQPQRNAEREKRLAALFPTPTEKPKPAH